ncbi:MAG: hypothetical protein EHM39_13595 [Chloroflexi bacterium]|nr:MAG: hypothetical protein EHM39_13595 [Chloroflexota bacterium]
MKKTTTPTAPRLALFSDFVRRVYQFEIESPDGEILAIEMRDVTADELYDATRDVKSPQPPFKDTFAKTADGTVIRELNYDDPAYLRALEIHRQKIMAAQIMKAWTATVPGETREEQIQQVMDLPAWVFIGLWKMVEWLITASEERIKNRPFRAVGSPAPEGV